MTDRLTAEQRHKNMQRIRNKDTKIELILRRALWNKGYRYRKNYSKLPGKPDIALTKYKIAVFCDSEFFHGRDWGKLEKTLLRGKNPGFWVNKISGNLARDHDVYFQLASLGWTVIRFWGKDIKKNPEGCVRAIEEVMFEKEINDRVDI